MDTHQGVKIRINDSDTEYEGSLVIDTEMISITSSHASTWDPAWSIIDDAGHWHGYSSKGETPTLARERASACVSEDCEDCGECFAVTYHCRICDQEIDPGRTWMHGAEQHIPGRTTWYLVIETTDVLAYGVEVVVRVSGIQGRWFGVALVIHESSQAASWEFGPVANTYRLHGVSPLGVRHVA